MTYEEILGRFKDVTARGDKTKAKCPCHDDKKASLSIAKEGNKILLHCHAGCETAAIVEAVGLSMKDLYTSPLAAERKEAWLRHVEKVTKQTLEARYDYYDSNGVYSYSKLRFSGKHIRYGTFDKVNQKMYLKAKNKKVDTLFLGRLSTKDLKQAIADNQTIYITEGEKDALSCQKKGLIAVTYGGASDWKKEKSTFFTNAIVVILRDNDKAGMETALKIYRDLKDITKKVSIKNPMPTKDKADITDFFAKGGTVEGLLSLPEEEPPKEEIEKALLLERFHRVNDKTGKPIDIIDIYISDYIIENYNIMVLCKIPYIYENGVYKADEDGIRIKEIIKNFIYPELVNYMRIARVYNLLIIDVRVQAGIDDINNYPNKDYWINFKNGILDMKTGEMHKHNPKYKSINQIPHNYIAGLDIKNSVFYKFLLSTIKDEENRKMLYEFMGYCLFPTFLFRKFLLLVGETGSGKSVIITLMENILGKDNISAVPLQDLSNNRFSCADLFNKLCNVCADISDDAIQDTGAMKRLTGKDTIRAERKGKDGFNFRNRAKCFFSCNALPLVLKDKSNAYYNRLLIIRFHGKGDHIEGLESKLAKEKEIEIVISHIVEGGKNIIERGEIFESGESLREVLEYQKDSDSVSGFIDECTIQSQESRETRPNLFSAYLNYCKEEDRTPLGKKAFYKALESKGYRKAIINGYNYFKGLEVKFIPTTDTPFH